MDASISYYTYFIDGEKPMHELSSRKSRISSESENKSQCFFGAHPQTSVAPLWIYTSANKSWAEPSNKPSSPVVIFPMSFRNMTIFFKKQQQQHVFLSWSMDLISIWQTNPHVASCSICYWSEQKTAMEQILASASLMPMSINCQFSCLQS